MRLEKLFLLIIFVLIQNVLFAQNRSVTGKITDATGKNPLVGATVVIRSDKDSTIWKGTTTDLNGDFKINNISKGRYLLNASYISFQANQQSISVRNEDINIGVIKLVESTTSLEGVTVEGRIQRVEQIGDTTQFNARAYKTNPDANTEDLVTKMPGVTSENGTLKVNGENVQQVLVDGKPFFGDDPNVALKNLPAEVVDKIQVFDRLSEQSQFSGFDDGQTSKTINIVTKPGMNNGQFGRVFVGYGTDDRYLGGGNINFFNGDRRISIIGLTNNINRQNFSSEDLAGAMSGSSGRGRGQRGGGGGSNAGNFMVGQSSGIATTHALGLNYSDILGEKVKVSASYFFNNSDNKNNAELNRTFIAVDSGMIYNEKSRTDNNSFNHRFNMRLEYNIDSANSIVVSPRLSFQRNFSDVSKFAETTESNGSIANSSENTNNTDNLSYNLSNNILYRHRFEKRGRSFSINGRFDYSNRDRLRFLRSMEEYTDIGDSTTNQRSDQLTTSYTIASEISYTEPLGKYGQIQANYSPSYRSGMTDIETKNFDEISQTYNQLETSLTNKFDNIYFNHSGGLTYQYNNKKIRFSSGVNVQYAELTGKQNYPTQFTVDKSFRNIMPQASLNYKFSKETNIRIFYRTSTSAPSVNQLQNVIDRSNPLYLTTGNPDLKQEYQHSLSLRYGNTNATKGRNLFIFLNASFTNNNITNATYIATNESEEINGVVLTKGTQLSMPVNLNGYTSTRSFFTYAFPVKLLKSNLNLNTGFTYNKIPGLINNLNNFANNYNISQGIALTSNISEKVDFNLSYNANYSIVKNTLQKQSDNNYFNQKTSLMFNWMPWKGLVFNTTLNHSLYRGLSQSFNQDFLLWNASLGYKFLKNRSLEVRASVFDIMSQNNSISREVTETYIEDSQTTILKRYFMFTLTYSLRNFKGSIKNEEDERPRMPGFRNRQSDEQ